MNDSQPITVDILMGTYNGSPYLGDQIASLQEQTHCRWHLYVRDDGSTDASPSIIDNIAAKDSRITRISDNQGNIGFNLNYHFLLSRVKSDFVMFCDQDDRWDRDKISKTLHRMMDLHTRKEGAPLLVHCDANVVDAEMVKISSGFVGARARLKGLVSVLMANPAQGATIMINRALLELLLRYPPQLPYDYKAALIAQATGYREFLDESLLMYRQHQSNAIGASVNRDESPRLERAGISATLKMGFDAAPAVDSTLREVKDRWHPCIERILKNHMNFVKPGFSLSKIKWIATNRYGFYRRRDHLHAIYHSLGRTIV